MENQLEMHLTPILELKVLFLAVSQAQSGKAPKACSKHQKIRARSPSPPVLGVRECLGANAKRVERHLLDLCPTVKPSALVADAIRDATQPDEIIFDPFLGSGTTSIAAQSTSRIWYIEIEPKFVDLAIRRWHAEADSEADDRSFNEAEEQANNYTASSDEEAVMRGSGVGRVGEPYLICSHINFRCEWR